MNTWKAILATLVIFGAGLVTGALWTRSQGKETVRPPTSGATARPNGARPRQGLSLEHIRKMELMMRVQKELNLTPEQRERIEKVISEGQEQIRDLWDPIAPEVRQVLQEVRENLCRELTPEQKGRFDELIKQQSGRRSSSSTNAPPAAPR